MWLTKVRATHELSTLILKNQKHLIVLSFKLFEANKDALLAVRCKQEKEQSASFV